MSISDELRRCNKPPKQGGLTRKEVNDLARKYGINPEEYATKSALCNRIAQIIRGQFPTQSLTNIEIANMLEELGNLIREEGDPHRGEALLNSSNIIRKFEEPITDPAVQLKGIKGIGSGTIARINEILATGTLKELKERQETPEEIITKQNAVKILSTVYGVGEKTALEFYKKGIRNLDELMFAQKNGIVILTENQTIGLYFYSDLLQRIPRDEVEAVGNIVLEKYFSLHDDNIGEIVGSYRRGRESSGDVDILISNSNNLNLLTVLVDELEKYENFIGFVLSQGQVSLHATYWGPIEKGDYGLDGIYHGRGLSPILHKIDIRFVEIESYGTALLHSTGSDEFNRYLRKIAIEKGLSLSEYGLYDSEGRKLDTLTEESVFEELGLEYIPPEERNL